MAYTFPLSAALFMDRLPIGSVSMDCPEQIEMSQTAGGEVLSATLAPRLWTGKITLGRMTRAEEAEARGLLDILRAPGRSFEAYEPRSIWPRLDPNGAALGAATPRLNSVAANNREITLRGLPAGYGLRIGDFLSFAYGSNPVRQALHKVVSLSVTANGSGVTPLFEVIPNIRPGAVTGTSGAPVRLHKPWCKAVLVPGSFEAGTSRRGLSEGTTFSFQQTLR